MSIGFKKLWIRYVKIWVLIFGIESYVSKVVIVVVVVLTFVF